MPGNTGYSRNERVYAQIASTFGVIPNTTGTATLAGSNCFRHIKVDLDPTIDLYDNPVKTGSRDMIAGIVGRQRWCLVTGTAPAG